MRKKRWGETKLRPRGKPLQYCTSSPDARVRVMRTTPSHSCGIISHTLLTAVWKVKKKKKPTVICIRKDLDVYSNTPSATASLYSVYDNGFSVRLTEMNGNIFSWRSPWRGQGEIERRSAAVSSVFLLWWDVDLPPPPRSRFWVRGRHFRFVQSSF